MPQLQFSVYDHEDGNQLDDIKDILGPDWGTYENGLLKFNVSVLWQFIQPTLVFHDTIRRTNRSSTTNYKSLFTNCNYEIDGLPESDKSVIESRLCPKIPHNLLEQMKLSFSYDKTET